MWVMTRSVTGLSTYDRCTRLFLSTRFPEWTPKAGYKPALRTADGSGAVAGCASAFALARDWVDFAGVAL